MSAKYNCDVCGRRLSGHQNVVKEFEFVSDDVRVRFIVDFNQWTEHDICQPCALIKIDEAAKVLKKNWKEHPDNYPIYVV